MKLEVACFDDETGHPIALAEVEQPPNEIHTLVESRVERALNYIKPFLPSNRGLHTLFFSSENAVIEEQIKNYPNYEVNDLNVQQIQERLDCWLNDAYEYTFGDGVDPAARMSRL